MLNYYNLYFSVGLLLLIDTSTQAVALNRSSGGTTFDNTPDMSSSRRAELSPTHYRAWLASCTLHVLAIREPVQSHTENVSELFVQMDSFKYDCIGLGYSQAEKGYDRKIDRRKRKRTSCHERKWRHTCLSTCTAKGETMKKLYEWTARRYVCMESVAQILFTFRILDVLFVAPTHVCTFSVASFTFYSRVITWQLASNAF